MFCSWVISRAAGRGLLDGRVWISFLKHMYTFVGVIGLPWTESYIGSFGKL